MPAGPTNMDLAQKRPSVLVEIMCEKNPNGKVGGFLCKLKKVLNVYYVDILLLQKI